MFPQYTIEALIYLPMYISESLLTWQIRNLPLWIDKNKIKHSSFTLSLHRDNIYMSWLVSSILNDFCYLFDQINQSFRSRVNKALSSLVTTLMWEFYPVDSPAVPQRKGNSVLEQVFFFWLSQFMENLLCIDISREKIIQLDYRRIDSLTA